MVYTIDKRTSNSFCEVNLMEQEKIIEFMKKKGINNPLNPTDGEAMKILAMMANTQSASDDAFFKAYFQNMTQAATAVIGGLKSFANAHVSKEYIESINKVIDQLNKDYEKATSDEEKEKIYNRIQQQLDRIREESEDTKGFLKRLGLYACGTALAVGAVAVTIKNKEAGKALMTQGMKMFKG